MAAFGFSLALLGTLFGFPEMRERLQVDVMRQGAMSSLLIAGIWVSTVIVGPLIDRFGNKVVLAVSSFLVSAAFLSFAVADSFALAAAAALLLGFGGGGLNTSTNVVVSELYDENRGSMLNLLGIFFGAGAVMVPLVAARMSPNAAIIFAAGFAFLCGVLYVVLPFPAPTEAHSFSLREALKVVTYPGVLLFSFILFFESANEQAMNTFTSTWLGGLGASTRIATLGLVGYQLAMAVGRIIAAPLLTVVSKRKVVMASAIGSVISVVALFSAHAVVASIVAVVASGLSFAAIYPTVLGIAGDRYQKFAGTVFGALFAIALLGGVAAPSAVGFIGQRFGLQYGKIVVVIGAAMLTVLVIAMVRSERGRTGFAREKELAATSK